MKITKNVKMTFTVNKGANIGVRIVTITDKRINNVKKAQCCIKWLQFRICPMLFKSISIEHFGNSRALTVS